MLLPPFERPGTAAHSKASIRIIPPYLEHEIEKYITENWEANDQGTRPNEYIAEESTKYENLAIHPDNSHSKTNHEQFRCDFADGTLIPPTCSVASIGRGIAAQRESLNNLISHAQEPFSTTLLRIIDKQGLSDPEVYKRANLDRKLFSKIRSNPHYQPTKATALALAIALKLDLNDTLDLIGRAGFTLSPSNKRDLVVRFFIEREQWDINTINQALYTFDLSILGR